MHLAMAGAANERAGEQNDADACGRLAGPEPSHRTCSPASAPSSIRGRLSPTRSTVQADDQQTGPGGKDRVGHAVTLAAQLSLEEHGGRGRDLKVGRRICRLEWIRGGKLAAHRENLPRPPA